MKGLRGGCLIGLLMIQGMVCAGEAEADPCDDAGQYSVVDVFDAAAPVDRRKVVLQALQAAAPTCLGSAYSLGLLYRHGAALPGNLVERDPVLARPLLLASAEGGNLIAYSDLAELELQSGNGREAMKWTQVYLALLKNYSSYYDQNNDFDRAGYNADLLRRAERAWLKQRPIPSRKLRSQDLNEYLTGRTSVIAAGLAEREARARNNEVLKVKRRKEGSCGVDLRPIPAAYATYLIEVQPNGAISRTVLENFAPVPLAGERLMRCVNVVEYEPHRSDDVEVARLPVMYGSTGGSKISK